jgi:hypothetical protein
MAKILVLSFSPLHADPRIRRQLTLLAGDHDVTAAGYTDPQMPGVRFVPTIGPRKRLMQRALAGARLRARRYESYYWDVGQVAAARQALGGDAYRLIIANEPDTWPLAHALRAGSGARVLFDAHEFAPREWEDVTSWRWIYQRYRRHLCRTFLPHADVVTTVSEGIADEYARCFGVRPVVVRNTPPRHDAEPSPVTPDRVRMIHHGAAIPSRRIETMIRALDHLDDRFSLDLMLVGNETPYLASLRELADARPRVRFRPAVPGDRIPEETQKYDLGLYVLEPANFNALHALPNKFFEFIQARLGVAIGPSPDMAGLVREFDCGVVAQDFRAESLASALASLTPESLARFKQNAHRAADVLCWERESERLLALVHRLLAAAPSERVATLR